MPSSSLRPGYSRRAHLSRFVGYVVAVVGLVPAGLLALLSALDPTGYGALKSVAADAAPPQAAPPRAPRGGAPRCARAPRRAGARGGASRPARPRPAARGGAAGCARSATPLP